MEARLRSRVLRYHAYFLNGKPEKLWEMMSRKLRTENDNDRAGFIRQLPIPPSGHAKTTLLSLKINGREARVTVKFDLLPIGTDQWLSETWEETWVYERRNWVFDSYRAIQRTEMKEGH
jgi:hypothetical protein